MAINGRFSRGAGWRRTFAGLLVALVVFFAGCVGGERLGSVIGRDKVELSFFINETGRPLDGDVFLDGRLIGNSVNGTAVINKAEMAAGELVLAGNDTESGADFRFRFELSAADKGFDRIRLQVPLKDYSSEVFDASRINVSVAEKEIFRLANEERAKVGIGPLRWNERIAEVARAYGKALPAEGFHHKDTAGRDVKERLSEYGIVFIVASENLYFTGSIGKSTDIARSAIDGWLGSPGHRATLLDRDGLYSDAGVGVHCERRECYVVMNFAGLRQEQAISLNKGWVTFHYLNNPGYNFAPEAVPVKLELSSSNPVNVYVVSDRGKYEELASGNTPDTLMEFRGVTSVDQMLMAESGEGIIIESPDSSSEVRFSIDFSEAG